MYTGKKTGQAATEMAIFGSLILVCFAVLLSYANTLTEQQALQQQAFRMALKKAYDSGSASYTILKNTRNVNLFGSFKQGSRGSTTASANVLWAKGEADSRGYYQVNEDVIEIPRYEKSFEDSDPKDIPAEVWDIETAADTAFQSGESKQEDDTEIVTSRSSQLTDTITTTLKLRYQTEEDGAYYYTASDQVFTQGLDTDGRYKQAAVGTTINKGRTWTTAH
jgi:hypothetical protein